MSEPIKILIVDDSAVVRGMMQRALGQDPNLRIVATAMDGRMAVDMLRRHPADIVILDIEMPGMDGLSALPELLKVSPATRIIMASTLTLRNAEISMKALALGASDYLAKPSARDAGAVDQFYREMIAKIYALAGRADEPRTAAPAARPPAPQAARGLKPLPAAGAIAAVAIASSTGGPQALLEIFAQLKFTLRVPVFITQHMPPNFTTMLAQHLARASGLDCHEARDAEGVVPGKVYVAPGDYHLTLHKSEDAVTAHLDQTPPVNFCRPSADPMIASLARIYGPKLLVIILTGIGSDGARGAAEAVQAGAVVIAQDELSSVVYGMPRAAAEAQIVSTAMTPREIGAYLVKVLS